MSDRRLSREAYLHLPPNLTYAVVCYLPYLLHLLPYARQACFVPRREPVGKKPSIRNGVIHATAEELLARFGI